MGIKTPRTRENTDVGMYIPPFILNDMSISFLEKGFLAEVNSLHKLGECYAANQHFAELFDLSYSRASKIIQSLIKRGYLGARYEREGKQIVKRTLWVQKPTEKSSEKSKDFWADSPKTSGQKQPEPLVENCQGNITKNITKNITGEKLPKGKNIPPSLADLQEYIDEYSKSKGIVPGFTAERFYDYYAQQGWKLKTKLPMVDWKASVRTWFSRQQKQDAPSGGEKYRNWRDVK